MSFKSRYFVGGNKIGCNFACTIKMFLRADLTCKDPFGLLNCNAPSLLLREPLSGFLLATYLPAKSLTRHPPSLVILTFRDRYGLLSGEGGRGTR